MALPSFEDSSLFEETRVSPSISADAAVKFFETYGVFYQSHSELGQLALQLRPVPFSTQNLDKVKETSATDARLRSLLEPYYATFCFILGPDGSNFYSMTAQEEEYPTAAVFLWPPGTELEFSNGSHTGRAIGVTAANGMIHRPYINLSVTRTLKDLPIKMMEGGILITHSKLAFSVKKGLSVSFGCKRH